MLRWSRPPIALAESVVRLRQLLDGYGVGIVLALSQTGSQVTSQVTTGGSEQCTGTTGGAVTGSTSAAHTGSWTATKI